MASMPSTMRSRIKRVTKLLSFLILTLLLLVSKTIVQSDNYGTEFYLAFLENYIRTHTLSLEVQLTSLIPATVTVEYPTGTILETVNVVPRTITTVTIPIEAQTGWTADEIAYNLVRLSSTTEFSAHMINRQPYSSDAALSLPIDALNTEYIVSTYDVSTLYSSYDKGEFIVFAPFDDTEVTITPSNALIGGHAPDVPFTITLNAGEGYFAQSLTTGPTGSLAGTIVEATRPIGVVNGNRCANIPLGVTYCDHIFEVAQPVQSWGNDILAYDLSYRTAGVVYRVLASVDGTYIMHNGVDIGTLDRGEFLEIGPITGGQHFQADNPIFVTQYLTGASSPGPFIGDPAMGNVVPYDQYQNNYTFSTIGGTQFVSNFVTIIAQDSDVGVLSLDGKIIPASQFQPLGVGFQATVQPISIGTHRTVSANPHGIMVHGYNRTDSYLYPGGAEFNFINPVNDVDVPIVSLSMGCDVITGTATDADSGIFSIVLGNSFDNLELTVDPSFVPSDQLVTFSLSRLDNRVAASGMATVTDGSGNVTEVPIHVAANCGLAKNDDSGVVASSDSQSELVFTDDDRVLLDGEEIEILPLTGETPRWRKSLHVLISAVIIGLIINFMRKVYPATQQ